jgi:hypothetical protein
MPGVGFEPTISVFERAKTVHALDRAAAAIGLPTVYRTKISELINSEWEQTRKPNPSR